MDTILFVQTGGTIDKDYLENPGNHGYNFAIDSAAFSDILIRARVDFTHRPLLICQKDSLEIDDSDRKTLKRLIKSAPEKMIVITHGTDTMHVTAEDLSPLAGKTIVLTGAFQPGQFRNTDADFNLGMAVAAVQILPHGVYIALRGEIKRWDEFEPR